MIICDEHNNRLNITDIHDIEKYPNSEYFWTLDLIERDWFLTKLLLIEDHESRTLTIEINNKLIELQADWHILVYSPETSEVDLVMVSDLTRSNFDVFVYDPYKHRVVNMPLRVTNYTPWARVAFPSINKNQMICCDIGGLWIMVAPTDTYTKYLKEPVTVGNFLNN